MIETVTANVECTRYGSQISIRVIDMTNFSETNVPRRMRTVINVTAKAYSERRFQIESSFLAAINSSLMWSHGVEIVNTP